MLELVGRPAPSRWCRSRVKRAIDVVLVTVSLPVAVPVIFALLVVSAIRFRCNPLFVQPRRGIHETEFRILKIRSLPSDFRNDLGKHFLEEDGFCRWANFLRRTHLDETPQILNILDGSMSIVGPRPMIPTVLAELTAEDRHARAQVRPGLTGAWQACSAGRTALHDCPELDCEYACRATMWTDLKILRRTAASLFGSDVPEPDAMSRELGWS